MSGERSHGTRDVELVEVDGTSAPTGSRDVEATGPPSFRDVWWRRHRWWLAPGLAVAIVAGISVVHAVQVRLYLAGLAGVPGIAAPIDGPVHELWSADASFQVLGQVGDVLVGTVTDGDGVMTARGVDAATGVVTWSVPVTVPAAWGGSCALADGPVTGPHRAVLACHVVDEATSVPPHAGVRSLGQPLRAHLATLDPLTGTVLGTVTAGPLDTIVVVGTDLAVASHEAGPTGGESTVRRWDPRTWAVVWTASRRDPAGGGSSSTSIQESGGVLLVQNAGDVWEVSASGVELRSWTGLRTDTGQWLTRTAGGHVLWTRYGQVAAPSEDGSGGTVFATDDTSVITDLGEGTSFALQHQVPWTADVDDGSAPDLLLVAGAEPVAYDLRTGKPIWRAQHEIGAFVVLDGTVYAAGTGTVSALDARTGATRWSVRTGTSLDRGALETDGRSLFVVTVRAGDDVSTVEALDLTSGSVSWTSTLSHAFDVLEVLGGHLAVVSYTDTARTTMLG